MSQDQEPKIAPKETESESPDVFLQLLVQYANMGIGVGITLQAGGLIISGDLVSGKDYFEGIAQETEAAVGDDDLKRVLAQSYRTFKEMYEKPNEGELTNEDREVSYIHLKDAKIIQNNQFVPHNRGVWWRGRLSSVDGFSFGKLS
jgi:hypothetical protein